MRKAKADAFDVELGQRLRQLRLMKGLSQHELGAPIGISFQQIQKYERGINRISVNRLFQLAERLECSPLALLHTHSAYRAATAETPSSEPLPTREQASLLRHFHAITEAPYRKLLIDISRALARIPPEYPAR